jgi:hypothetical protein
MVLEKMNLAWLKSNTCISCVVVTHLSLLTRFALNSLLGDANDVTIPEQRKQTLRKNKKYKILNVLCILYYVLYISLILCF